jgi:glycosyltransferase involved in cell wall biosynthesis
MRILTVSAHYPPNFVSGGTLQPQRLSQGLRARGHDVSVFAGWLGERPPLDTWIDTDETGMDVRWVVSAPWIGWSDERNWHNPPVTEVFREHLDEVRPDLVHFHSLQSLGAGLVPVAHAAGAKVVVTMHDFWWLCARQFLVDTGLRPCSLVVDAGACACESGSVERDRRLRALRTLLAPADLVLAPSASAAEVLAANGVAPGRLEVDENGLPDLDGLVVGERRSTRAADDPIRFVYTGGPNPMKGAAHLVEAARKLAATPGWTLTAFGLGDYLDETGVDLAGLPVDVRQPFVPEDLAGILAAHDVFVLPSVMRETHSLATREALVAGLPVLCTDTLGPEEVVVHGSNGLIVPAGDAEALASSVARLASDRVLLDHLRTGAGEPIALRHLDDHVDGLAARFERLVAGDAPTADADARDGARGSAIAAAPAVDSVLFVVGIEGAPLRYRARLPAEALALEGLHTEVRHYRDPELLALGGRADVVVFYRVPATIQILELITTLRATGTPCAFDVDDLIFDPDIRDEIPALRLLPPDEARLWLEGVNRYRTTLEACDAYIGSTTALVEHAERLTALPVHRFTNGVGQVLARRADRELRRPRRPGPPRIGYFSGTTTHDEDWFFVEPSVLDILDRYPDAELWLGGHLPESAALTDLGDRLVRIPFVPWLDLPGELRDLDVNLAPLAPGSAFNEAKSAIKWLEAALVETPTIATPTEPFREAIVHGESGLLAATPGEWIDALDHLLATPAERARIGARARRRALLTWSPELQGQRYRAILADIAGAGPRPDRSGATWSPVALDEPAMPVPLEPYLSADELDAAPPASAVPLHQRPAAPSEHPTVDRLLPRAQRVESIVRRTVAKVRRDGAAATASAATRKLTWWLDRRRSHP